MKNTLLFTYSTNILVRLLTVNMKNFSAPKIRKCATPFQYLYWKCDPIIVNPVVKMRPHPAAHPRYPLLRNSPSPRDKHIACTIVTQKSLTNIIYFGNGHYLWPVGIGGFGAKHGEIQPTLPPLNVTLLTWSPLITIDNFRDPPLPPHRLHCPSKFE